MTLSFRWGGMVLLVGIILGCSVSNKESSSDKSAEQSVRYHCPMHPTYISDRPGECPICHMSLVPIVPEASSPSEESSSQGVPGQAPIHLSEEREQLIGVRTAVVEKQELFKKIRASGRVAYDPTLYNAIAEYREAHRALVKTRENPWPEVQARSAALVRSSALRLRRLGLSETEIARLDGEEETSTTLLFGQKGPVWIYVDLYEYESSWVKPGQTVEITGSSLAGRRREGRVVAVDPVLNPETRTLRARVEASNPDGVLKPEMYVDAALRVELGRKRAVPEEAVLDTGLRRIVFVKSGPGHYEPREVELGIEAEGFWEVLNGLEEGDTVVVSGNFFVDSESKLKSALSPAAGGGHRHD